MAYSADVKRRAKARLDAERAKRQSLQEQRLQEAYYKVPRLRQIDMLLRQSMAQAAMAAFSHNGDAQEMMEKVRQENKILQKEREELVLTNFPAGYLMEGPFCDICGGVGYIGTQMCLCMQSFCQDEQNKMLTRLACGTASFKDFQLKYYSDAIDPKYGASPRAVMERTYAYCKKYAENFGTDGGNLLFVGGTGLGKTMLSACIATAVTKKGYAVSYESAVHLFSKLERDRFNPTEESHREVSEIFHADLLIIDDLGTEMQGNFVTTALYTLVNDRLMDGKPTIISTNLNADELGQRYSPQIASRLHGAYRQLTFVGEDIRLIKR